MAPRPGPYARLIEHFHTHRFGRLMEIGLFLLIAALIALAGLWIYDYPNEALAYLTWIVAACVALFGLLPHGRKAAPPPPLPKGKRGEIAKKVAASKAEKRKGPDPPIQ